jgi:hypothetical protein
MVRTTHGEDGAIVLDIQRGRVLRLNAAGSFILEHLERGETELQISMALSERFRISREVAQTDVGEFLISLKQAALVQQQN